MKSRTVIGLYVARELPRVTGVAIFESTDSAESAIYGQVLDHEEIRRLLKSRKWNSRFMDLIEIYDSVRGVPVA
jgi:hypothetical protein